MRKQKAIFIASSYEGRDVDGPCVLASLDEKAAEKYLILCMIRSNIMIRAQQVRHYFGHTRRRAMESAILNLTIGGTQHKFRYRKGTSDEGVIVQVLKNSDYNFKRLRRAKELSCLYEELAQSGKSPLIIDAGANIGASAVYFAFSFPMARVVAIEPERGNFDLLVSNAAGLSVECLNSAVAASAGVLNVVDPGEGFWGYRTVGFADNASVMHAVNCVSINDIYESHKQNAVPFIVKIDIEGSESELFAANTEWVDRTPIIIVELHDWLMPRTANSRTFLECIAGRDRDFIHIGENIFSISNSPTPYFLPAGQATGHSPARSP